MLTVFGALPNQFNNIFYEKCQNDYNLWIKLKIKMAYEKCYFNHYFTWCKDPTIVIGIVNSQKN